MVSNYIFNVDIAVNRVNQPIDKLLSIGMIDLINKTKLNKIEIYQSLSDQMQFTMKEVPCTFDPNLNVLILSQFVNDSYYKKMWLYVNKETKDLKVITHNENVSDTDKNKLLLTLNNIIATNNVTSLKTIALSLH